jgi:hypothetical protein
LITRAPAFMQSRIAVASSSGVALGKDSPTAAWAKMGRIIRAQSGQMAGATEPRFADRIPATKVPWRRAAPSPCAPPLWASS